jgi:hypothetical protein
MKERRARLLLLMLVGGNLKLKSHGVGVGVGGVATAHSRDTGVIPLSNTSARKSTLILSFVGAMMSEKCGWVSHSFLGKI